MLQLTKEASKLPIPVAGRSKTLASAHSLSGIAFSNSFGGVDFCRP